MNKFDFSAFFADLRKKRLGIAILFALCAVGVAVLAVLQCYFLQTQFDTAYFVYGHGSVAGRILFWIAAAFAAVSLAVALIVKKDRFCEEERAPLAAQKALWLTVSFAHLVLFCWLCTRSSAVFANALATLVLQFGNLCVIAYGIVASGVLGKMVSSLNLRVYLRFGALLFLLMRVFSLYFDRTTPMTAPLKTIEIMAALALCLYMLCSLRRDLGIPFARVQWAVGAIAVMLCGLCGAGGVYLWVLYPAQFTAINAFAFVYLAWAVLVGLELWCAVLPAFLRRMTDYLVFGVLTTCVNFVSYFLLTRFTAIPLLVANIIACVISIAFAYAVNKFFVFEEVSRHGAALAGESGAFVLSRLATMGLEELILWLFVYVFAQNDLLAKVIAAVVVVITNYVTGRFLVFRKQDADTDSCDTL